MLLDNMHTETLLIPISAEQVQHVAFSFMENQNQKY